MRKEKERDLAAKKAAKEADERAKILANELKAVEKAREVEAAHSMKFTPKCPKTPPSPEPTPEREEEVLSDKILEEAQEVMRLSKDSCVKSLDKMLDFSFKDILNIKTKSYKGEKLSELDRKYEYYCCVLEHLEYKVSNDDPRRVVVEAEMHRARAAYCLQLMDDTGIDAEQQDDNLTRILNELDEDFACRPYKRRR